MIIPSPPSAIFFDLDGTLIDSIGLIVACFQGAVQKHLGYTPTTEEILAKIGMPLRPTLEALAPHLGAKLLETYREIQFSRHEECVKPFNGTIELLHMLQKQNIITGVVTSKARRGTTEALKLFGPVSEKISIRITVDDCINHKPHPEPLIKAAEMAGVSVERCWYVGDTIFDMQAAIAAKMHPIGVTWGVADRKTLEEYTKNVFDEVDTLKIFTASHI